MVARESTWQVFDANSARVAAANLVAAQAPLLTVQVLRAIAATLVLIGHAQGEVVRIAAMSGFSYARIPMLPGGFGVDLFFCISGFIMMVSSQSLFGKSGASRSFLLRRVIRLVPLYWLVTLVYLPLLLLGTRGYSGDLSLALATSLAFIPFPTYGQEGGLVFPLYSLGWTLNYEMFFYLIFSLFVGLSSVRAAIAVLVTLSLLVICGTLLAPDSIPLHFWSQPIILEFGFGILIGSLRFSRRMQGGAVQAVLLVIALLLLLLDPLSLSVKVEGVSTANGFVRVLGWGIPAALLLLAAVMHERTASSSSAGLRRIAYLGDCSYSLYLIHPFVIIFLSKAWRFFHVEQYLGWSSLFWAIIVCSFLLSMLVHRYVEKPMTKWLRARFERPLATSLNAQA